jgi:hypothetical protein
MSALSGWRARWFFVAPCALVSLAQSCGGDVVIGENQQMQRQSTPEPADEPVEVITEPNPETPVATDMGEPEAPEGSGNPDDWRPPWEDDDADDEGRPPMGEGFDPEGAPSSFIDRGDRGLDDLAGPAASFTGEMGTGDMGMNAPMNGPPDEEFFSPEPDFGSETADAAAP